MANIKNHVQLVFLWTQHCQWACNIFSTITTLCFSCTQNCVSFRMNRAESVR